MWTTSTRNLWKYLRPRALRFKAEIELSSEGERGCKLAWRSRSVEAFVPENKRARFSLLPRSLHFYDLATLGLKSPEFNANILLM